MPRYELTYILGPKAPEPGVEKAIVEAGGNIVASRVLGEKRLEYPIKKQGLGVFHTITLEAEPQVAISLNQRIRATEGVLRHLIVASRIAALAKKSPPKKPVQAVTALAKTPKVSPKGEAKARQKVLEEKLEELLKEA